MTEDKNTFPRHQSVTEAWANHLQAILRDGITCQPRGKMVTEVPALTMSFDMRHPVIICPTRKLSYRFMAAEALWILTGGNLLAPLVSLVPRMAEYSDDGVTLTGAYGPPFLEQLPYVVNCLVGDEESRQAVIQLWRPSPEPSKDIPCTTSLVFQVRNGELRTQVYMRSSDAYLGIPYDTFSFTMMSLFVLTNLNQQRRRRKKCAFTLGGLSVTAASAHLYQENWTAAYECIRECRVQHEISDGLTALVNPLPIEQLKSATPYQLIQLLEDNAGEVYAPQVGNGLGPGDALHRPTWRVRP